MTHDTGLPFGPIADPDHAAYVDTIIEVAGQTGSERWENERVIDGLIGDLKLTHALRTRATLELVAARRSVLTGAEVLVQPVESAKAAEPEADSTPSTARPNSNRGHTRPMSARAIAKTLRKAGFEKVGGHGRTVAGQRYVSPTGAKVRIPSHRGDIGQGRLRELFDSVDISIDEASRAA